MNKIVETGMKIDLHIHSVASSHKDKKKVRNNTLENIPLLIQKLNENGVNICAITDHDAFSYNMYCALKSAEGDDSSIKKVLPGVEFSVRFLDSEEKERVVHVVTIFSDKDETKVSKIEEILSRIGPDEKNSYAEEDFLKVLREINLDTILIAHQKNTLSSQRARINDASSLGEEKFFELVSSDYFEAYEFKNKKNEILNKNYLVSKGLEDKIRFVTGTDCHDWTAYPRETPGDNVDDFPYTYAKCLPTFRGLVMAMTDRMRLRTVNSFFNVDKFYLEQISLESNGKQVSIPLSRGINVIIGDNSIGKSLLLHALTGFKKNGDQLPKQIENGYKNYIKKNNLKIKSQLKAEDVFAFDMQGEIRKKFEENRLVATEFAKYFPNNLNPQPYKAIIYKEIDRIISYLGRKFELDHNIEKLAKFRIYAEEISPESLSFVGDLRKNKENSSDTASIIEAIHLVEVNYSDLLKKPLDEEDRKIIHAQQEMLSEMRKKYQRRKTEIEIENDRIETVAKAIDRISRKHGKSISDGQKRISAFIDNTTSLKETIKTIIQQSHNLKRYSPDLGETRIEPECNSIQGYRFISKFNVDLIDTDYFMQHVKGLFNSKKRINLDTITEQKLKDALLKYNDGIPVLDFMKRALVESFDGDFRSKQIINLESSDKTEELSSGLNAKIYFDLLSYEGRMDGVYIIDQPEDNVSQPAIKEYLIDCFKAMGENRQVIMVTHNPQFIVNLDIDNLIYLSKGDDGTLNLQSGALEYECVDYQVLQLVADNIEGGLDSIQKRWKRYEKANKV